MLTLHRVSAAREKLAAQSAGVPLPATFVKFPVARLPVPGVVPVNGAFPLLMSWKLCAPSTLSVEPLAVVVAKVTVGADAYANFSTGELVGGLLNKLVTKILPLPSTAAPRRVYALLRCTTAGVAGSTPFTATSSVRPFAE